MTTYEDEVQRFKATLKRAIAREVDDADFLRSIGCESHLQELQSSLDKLESLGH